MLTLFHHGLCPQSRFVRLALGEYGITHRLVEERPWERRHEFLAMNPAGTLPVLVEEGRPPIPEARTIAEYLDETRGTELGDHRLLPPDLAGRVEVRRLLNRQMSRQQGGGSPDTDAIRAASANIRYHLAYIGWLVQTRDWLAGERLSYADLAAAAHLSSVDYLGDVPWSENEAAKSWYARVKSRPSFRPLLIDTHAGVPPSKSYADLDF
jgi:glutathione S-transferase